MKYDEKSLFQEIVDRSLVPMIIFYYESGRIIAYNSHAEKIIGKKNSNMKTILGKESTIWLVDPNDNGSYMEYEKNIPYNSSEGSYNCEYNVIALEEDMPTVVIMSFQNSFRRRFQDKYIYPKIYWQYVNEDNKMEKKIYCSDFLMQRMKLSKDNVYEMTESMIQFEDFKKLKEIDNRVAITKMPEFDNIKMMNINNENYFDKYSKIPVINKMGKVICVITIVNSILNNDNLMEMIDNACVQREIMDGVVSEGNNLFISIKLGKQRKIRYISSNISTLGYSPRDFYTGDIELRDVVHKDDVENVTEKHMLLRKSNGTIDKLSLEFRLIDKDSNPVWVHMEMKCYTRENEVICNGILHRIEKRKNKDRNYDEVILSDKLIAAINEGEAMIQNSDAMFIVIDSKKFIIKGVNRKVRSDFKIHQEAVNGKDFFEFVEELKLSIHGDYCYCSKNDRYYSYSKRYKDEKDKTSDIIVTLIDITNIINRHSYSRIEVDRDELTGLLTRKGLESDMERSIRKSVKEKKNGALLAIDIDNLKNIGIRYGAEVSDSLLRQLSFELEKNRNFIDHVYRLAGDTIYAVIDCDKNLDVIINEALNGVSNQIDINDKTIKLSVSVGVTLYPKDGVKKSILIENAKSAVKRAKALGRGRVSYFKYISETKVEALMLDNQMKMDVAAGYENFEVMFEPVYSLDSEKINAAMCSLKWYNKNVGYMNPNFKITNLEGDMSYYTMQSIPLGEFIFNNAFSMCKKMNDTFNKNFKVVVKTSVFHICSENFTDRLGQLLRVSGVKPENIIIDLSDFRGINDMNILNMIISGIKNTGVKVMMRTHLERINKKNVQDYRVNYLCLDESILKIMDMIKTGESKKLSELFAVCKNLNIELIYSNIDNLNQVNKIKRLSKGMIYGEYIGKPTDAEGFFNIYTD